MQMWFAGEHLEVEPTSRLAYSEALADRDGAPLPREEAGLPGDHPITTRVIVDLAASENGTMNDPHPRRHRTRLPRRFRVGHGPRQTRTAIVPSIRLMANPDL